MISEKLLTKIQYPFIIKNYKQASNGRELPQLEKEYL